jgi:hypothetical protein
MKYIEEIEKAIAEEPQHWEGRGIVTCAGGRIYFANAYANCRLIRDLGCNLPIFWFYLGEEMRPAMIQAAEEIPGVKCIDLDPTATGFKQKSKGGWQIKCRSILEAPINEVLFLDADCFPDRNPEYLFESDPFREFGTILYPDVWTWSSDRLDALDRWFGVRPLVGSRQVESGQMYFDKNRCQKALRVVAVYNEHADEVYKVVFGDKDTFLIGYLRTETPYYMNPHLPDCNAFGLLHKDLEGKRLFTHCTGGKWDLHGRNDRVQGKGFIHFDKVQGYLSYAKARVL